MALVRYLGPYDALEIDGVTLERNGEPVQLTADQVKRLESGNTDRKLEVLSSEGKVDRVVETVAPQAPPADAEKGE